MCKVREANAAEPRNPSEKFRSGVSPQAMPEHLGRRVAGHGATALYTLVLLSHGGQTVPKLET